ncbi:MAG TPA: 1-acyl-sn-glycerol-3-phosphate acyltransferase [Candidatus Akkermansia intestinigallinarum]|uniref:1-acyl-sn-glycerol-3-phosphate acyltransferase n=1 Tax=Candidatus Akkermansia intestinigallinarum TaxID=2838431 RepID=A0A9D1VA48_9BACT|nr:1-acyl-sn-glycerol-3-phosphate acyltransferase [Candidatus Akkermansia intestinigallinarum]
MNPIYFVSYHIVRGVVRGLFDLKIINREKLIEDGPCVYVCNHQSFLDPPVIGQIFDRSVNFLARKTLFTNGFMHWLLPKCHALPIDQQRPDPASIMKVLRVVRNGEAIVIFPEGARSPDGKIHEAMPGIGLIISRLASVPVQPLRIEGAYDCLPIHSKRLRLRPITVSVGDPIEFTPQELKARTRDEQRAIGRKVMAAIAALPTRG